MKGTEEKMTPKEAGRKGGLTKKKNAEKRKHKLFLIKLFIFELYTCALIIMTAILINTIENYTKVYDISLQQADAIEKLTREIKSITIEQEHPIAEVTTIKTDDNLIAMGNFKLTYYCACKKCCGQNACGITASGKKVEEGKTIAVDPKVIKLGSKVVINGHEYEAQDTGSAIKGNIIDIYVSDHNEALKLGVNHADVFIKEV